MISTPCLRAFHTGCTAPDVCTCDECDHLPPVPPRPSCTELDGMITFLQGQGFSRVEAAAFSFTASRSLLGSKSRSCDAVNRAAADGSAKPRPHGTAFRSGPAVARLSP